MRRGGECAGSVCSGLPSVLETRVHRLREMPRQAKGKGSPSRRMCQPNWMSPVPEDQFQTKVVDRTNWVIGAFIWTWMTDFDSQIQFFTDFTWALFGTKGLLVMGGVFLLPLPSPSTGGGVVGEFSKICSLTDSEYESTLRIEITLFHRRSTYICTYIHTSRHHHDEKC